MSRDHQDSAVDEIDDLLADIRGERGPQPGEFTLSGWQPGSAVGPRDVRRSRRLELAYVLVGGVTGVVSAWILASTWTPVGGWGVLVGLALLALVAQSFPVHVSYTNVSLGIGFLLAGCLLAGPVVGAATAAMVAAIWSLLRPSVPWFHHASRASMTERVARSLYAAGSTGLVYWLSGTAAFASFALEPPIHAVTVETLSATIVLTVGVYLLHNLMSLAVAALAGDDPMVPLRTVIPVPALAEFLALPAAMLLAVSAVRLGPPAFALLAWLYLMAAFLGWRSWQDRVQLKRRLDDVELLRCAGELLTGTLELGDLVRRMRRIIRDMVELDRLVLLVRDAPGAPQVFVFDGEGLRGEIDDHEAEVVESQPEGLYFDGFGGATFVRDLSGDDTAVVRLRLDLPAAAAPSPARLQLLETVCGQAGSALSNARLYRLANTDPLTGLAVRRYFERALRASAIRGEGFGVVMLDLDWFKRVNDEMGHRVGDRVLRDLSTVLTGTLRVMDVAARYGGEEFVILLPGSSSPEAAAAAERVRRILDQRQLSVDGRTLRYTASFGVAASTDIDDRTDPMEVVWLADAALLEAKRAGRNQVVTYGALRLDRMPQRPA